LQTGDEEGPFLNVIEYGVWDLCDRVEMRISAAMILAMMDALEDMWIVEERGSAS